MSSFVPLHLANPHRAHHRSPRRYDQAGTLAAAVGNTPVLRITSPFADDGRGFWAKLEGSNPGGIKDRTALHMVSRARARGDLRPGARIIESSSGTLGLGLALAGMAYRHRPRADHRPHAVGLRGTGRAGRRAPPRRRLAAGPL